MEGELCFTVYDGSGVGRLPPGLLEGILVRTVRYQDGRWVVELVDRGAARMLGIVDQGTWEVDTEFLVPIEPGRICLEWPDDEPVGTTLWERALAR